MWVANMKVVLLKVESDELEVVNDFDPSLDNMQKAVGGYIEAVDLVSYEKGRTLTLWVNEEGKINGSEPNFVLMNKKTQKIHDIVYGDVILTACDMNSGKTVGLSDVEVQWIKDRFNMSYGLITPVFVTRTLFVGEE